MGENKGWKRALGININFPWEGEQIMFGEEGREYFWATAQQIYDSIHLQS